MTKKFSLKVKTQAKHNEVVQLSETELSVKTAAAPTRGKANDAVVKLLAEFFRLPKWKIQILTGKASPHKVIEVME